MSEDNINLSMEEAVDISEIEETETAADLPEDNDKTEQINSDISSVASEDVKKEKKMSRFTKAFLIYTSALVVLVLTALIFFWDYMAAYEKSLPESAVNSYISSLDTDMWTEILKKDVTFVTNEFENTEDIFNKVSAMLTESNVSFVKNYDSFTDENPAYSLTRDGKKFAEIVLVQGGEVGFGFTSWDVVSCNVIKEAFALETFSVSISLPEGANGVVNGVEINVSYITEKSAESNQTSPYEATHADRLKCDVYTISGFYFVPEITADLDGESLTSTTEGTSYFFAYPKRVFSSITVSAPSNSVLTLNGVEVKETPSHKTEITGGVFEGNLGDVLTMNTYVIDGLVAEPEIICKINGIEINSNDSAGVTAFDYPLNLLYDVKIMVPVGSAVTVNGHELSKDYFIGNEIYDSFDKKSFANWLGSYPQCDVYEISGLYVKPEVKVIYNGTELVIDVETTENNCVYVSEFPSSDEIPNDISTRALGFARAFMYYTSCGYYNIDLNLQAALSYTLVNSDAYTNIKNSRIGVYYNDYYELTYNKLETVSYVKYTDDCIALRLDFDVDRNIYQYSNHEEGTYNIIMIRSGNNWYVAEFNMITISE